MEFETWLSGKGFDPAELSSEQRQALEGAWRAEEGGGVAEPPKPGASGTAELERITADARSENARRTTITTMVAKAIAEQPDRVDIFEKVGTLAIEGKWDSQKAELEILRHGRPDAPAAFARTERQVTDRVIEAAVCRAGGLSGLESHFDERTLDASDKAFRHGLSLGDLIMTYARRGGYTGHNYKANPKAALQAAFSPELRAAGSWGPSTGGGLSGVLGNTANKFLREGFMYVERAWSEIAARRSVNDFKQITTYSVTGGLTFNLVPPGGEIKHGQLGSESYTNQINTRGVMLGLDRRDIINDDLGALTGVSRRMGRSAGIGINKDFWGVQLNNSSFYTAGRNNVSTGAGSALSLAGLDAAYAKFLTQTDPDGNIQGTQPAILLVPPALFSTAQTLMTSAGVVSGATTVPGTPNNNIWAGRFRVVSSAYMQDSTLTGNSAVSWYLLADPMDVPTIEIAFLNGVETPTVENAEADFSMLGVAMRAYLDWGVALQEYRGGVRSAGS